MPSVRVCREVLLSIAVQSWQHSLLATHLTYLARYDSRVIEERTELDGAIVNAYAALPLRMPSG